jgi:uncharacterized membrane protein YsdA (DUF1294 family)
MITNIPFAILMVAGIVYAYGKTNQMILCHPYFAWMVAVNVTAFVFYGMDKILAWLKQYITLLPRVAEALLLSLSIIGGFIGAGLGMILWGHKIGKKHWYFTFCVLLGLGIHAFLLYRIMNNQLAMAPLTNIMSPLVNILKELRIL